LKILHTSDWHLGRTLERRDRLDEQQEFLEEICDIANKERVDMVIVAGDVFDTVNPPAKAEQLFYNYISELSLNGRRSVVVIAGNHDNPERLKAAVPLAAQMGIVLLGLPKDIAAKNIHNSDDKVRVVKSGFCWFELHVPPCDHSAVIISLPYPSEQRLSEVLTDKLNDKNFQKKFSERIASVLNQAALNFKNDTVNICTSHLYVSGGVESGSERCIQLGGTYAVDVNTFPKCHYTALGHLHRSQSVAGKNDIRYSGSPLAYSFAEAGQVKSVCLAECLPRKEVHVEEVPLNSGRRLVKWTATEGMEQAIKWCESTKDANSWIDLEIHTEKPLNQHEVKELKKLRPHLVSIRLKLPEMKKILEVKDYTNMPIVELFEEFYYTKYGSKPDKELTELFLEFVEAENLNQ